MIDMIKDIGWHETTSFVGGSEELLTIFNNDPMEFLNIYNDLDVVQSERNEDLILFKDEKGNNLMVYDRKIEEVFISNDYIWSVLRNDFGLNINETQELTQRWLSEAYNLRGGNNFFSFSGFHERLSEVYNLKNEKYN